MTKKRVMRCWEYFKCLTEAQMNCLMAEVEEPRCWTVNIVCCKINKDTPRPLSAKRIVCKTCEYYREFNKPE